MRVCGRGLANVAMRECCFLAGFDMSVYLTCQRPEQLSAIFNNLHRFSITYERRSQSGTTAVGMALQLYEMADKCERVQKSWAPLRGRSRFLVLQIVGSDQSEDGIAEEVPILPVVESPRHLLALRQKDVRRRPSAKCQVRTFELGERGFNRAGCAQTPFIHVFISPVVDPLCLRPASVL